MEQVEALFKKYNIPTENLSNVSAAALDTTSIEELEKQLKNYKALKLSLRKESLTEEEDLKLQRIFDKMDNAGSQEEVNKIREENADFLGKIRSKNRTTPEEKNP